MTWTQEWQPCLGEWKEKIVPLCRTNLAEGVDRLTSQTAGTNRWTTHVFLLYLRCTHHGRMKWRISSPRISQRAGTNHQTHMTLLDLSVLHPGWIGWRTSMPGMQNDVQIHVLKGIIASVKTSPQWGRTGKRNLPAHWSLGMMLLGQTPCQKKKIYVQWSMMDRKLKNDLKKKRRSERKFKLQQ